jgi:hypothetical protein
MLDPKALKTLRTETRLIQEALNRIYRVLDPLDLAGGDAAEGDPAEVAEEAEGPSLF